jgi:hypothetical protein
MTIDDAGYRIRVIGFLMDIHAQQPPNQKKSDDCKENALNPLACPFWVRRHLS